MSMTPIRDAVAGALTGTVLYALTLMGFDAWSLLLGCFIGATSWAIAHARSARSTRAPISASAKAVTRPAPVRVGSMIVSADLQCGD